MSQIRKNQLINQIMKVGNLNKDYRDWLTLVYRLASERFKDLTREDFVEITSKYGDKQYFEEIVKIIDQTFSEEEIEQIFNFWTSPAGRKLVNGLFREKQKEFHTMWAQSIESACQNIRKSRQEGIHENDKSPAS